jgi:hypothetical protein
MLPLIPTSRKNLRLSAKPRWRKAVAAKKAAAFLKKSGAKNFYDPKPGIFKHRRSRLTKIFLLLFPQKKKCLL